MSMIFCKLYGQRHVLRRPWFDRETRKFSLRIVGNEITLKAIVILLLRIAANIFIYIRE